MLSPPRSDVSDEEKTDFDKKAKVWRVTWSGLGTNDLTHDDIKNKILELWADHKPLYVIGKELHKEPENPDKPWHFHAHVQFDHKVRGRNCRMLDIKGFHPRIKGTFGPAYASKDGDYIHNRFDEDKWKPLPKVKVFKPKYSWQTRLVAKLKEEPDRCKIIWRWEDTGNVGKTEFARWAVVDPELGECLVVGGRAVDAKCAVAAMLQRRKEPRVVFFTVPRDGTISYRALEELKDGLFFSSKYESGMCVFNPPHVVVFTNHPPDTSRLSTHRWDIEEIKRDT